MSYPDPKVASQSAVTEPTTKVGVPGGNPKQMVPPNTPNKDQPIKQIQNNYERPKLLDGHLKATNAVWEKT